MTTRKRWDIGRWVELSSPVTLGFAGLSLIALLLNGLTGGASNRALFSVYRFRPGDVLGYLRLVLHVLGHANFAHYAGNMSLLLVLGPMVEKHYGAGRYLIMIVLTALITGLAHIVLSPGTAGLGASGVVFMLIMLSALAGRTGGKVPLTLIVVAVIYLGGELAGGLFGQDNVSQLAHIAGGVCGIIFGMAWKGRPAP
ncbi:MAG: rhomboid family intramembrane serine protease [Clostridiales bacterium]|nr:rhomboid family intramembrane serine protease [Clostridiales bacterium]